MFWEIFVKLCNEHNTKPNPVAKALKLSSGSVTKWKGGAMPNDTTLYKIANYFGVPVSYLKGEEAKAEDGQDLKEYVVFHRDGKTMRVKFTPEQQKIFDALVAATKAEEAEKQIRQIISDRLDDTNNRVQTDRIVDAINNK